MPKDGTQNAAKNMNRVAHELLERAKSDGFVYQGRCPSIADNYFMHCSREAIPYVRIRARRARMWANDVSVDMISTGKVLSPDACDKALDAIRRHADPR